MDPAWALNLRAMYNLPSTVTDYVGSLLFRWHQPPIRLAGYVPRISVAPSPRTVYVPCSSNQSPTVVLSGESSPDPLFPSSRRPTSLSLHSSIDRFGYNSHQSTTVSRPTRTLVATKSYHRLVSVDGLNEAHYGRHNGIQSSKISRDIISKPT